MKEFKENWKVVLIVAAGIIDVYKRQWLYSMMVIYQGLKTTLG